MDLSTLLITPELLHYISEVDEFKGSWSVQSGLNPDRLQALRHVATIESIVEKNNDAYYPGLQRTQKSLKSDKTDWLPWLTFFLHLLKRQKDHLSAKTATDTEGLECQVLFFA